MRGPSVLMLGLVVVLTGCSVHVPGGGGVPRWVTAYTSTLAAAAVATVVAASARRARRKRATADSGCRDNTTGRLGAPLCFSDD